jgi:hypothetical protein
MMIVLTLLTILSFGICLPTVDMGPPIKRPKIAHLYNPAYQQPLSQHPQSSENLKAYTGDPINQSLGPPNQRKTPVMKEIVGLRRIVAVGEINSNYDDLVRVLQSLRIINDSLDWTVNNIYLVQLGNSIGNGRNPADARSTAQVIRLWEKLISQARTHNSEVVLLVGPNEIDTLSGMVFVL